MNKKLLLLLGSIVGAITLAFAGSAGYEWYQDNFAAVTKKMTVHDVATMTELIASIQDGIIYVADPSCGDSDEFESWFLADLPQTDWETAHEWHYVSVKSLRDNGTFEDFKATYAITTTPTLVHVVDGEIVDQIAWSLRDGFDQTEVTAWINAQ
ncbi:MAG: hypothetical protein ACRDCC_06505 [Culicoidibacterales bacterium]